MRRGLPIRLRLTIASAVLMAIVIALLGSFLTLRLEADLGVALDDRLRDHAAAVDQITDDPTSLDRVLFGDPGDTFVQVLAVDGSVVASTPGIGAALLPPMSLVGLDGERFFDARIDTAEEPVPARLLLVPRDAGGAIVIGASTEDQDEALTRLTGLLAIGGPLAIALASGVGWLVAGAALRPVERLRIEAEAVSASEPGRRLAVPETGDELARLAVSLNRMLGRLEEAAARERRFVAAASHELRTPLANLKAELDLALRRSRTRDELEQALHSAADESERLNRLAEDLLVVARAGGAAGLPLRREPVDVAGLLRETTARFAIRADAEGIGLRVDAAEAVPVFVDPDRIRQAIGNLIDNALRHSPRGGHVDMRATTRDASAEVSIADSGPGFDGESVGSGLGLSIVRAIAYAHGGSVLITDEPDGGARVTIRLPHAGLTGDSSWPHGAGPRLPDT